jgi:hypothetical protein
MLPHGRVSACKKTDDKDEKTGQRITVWQTPICLPLNSECSLFSIHPIELNNDFWERVFAR